MSAASCGWRESDRRGPGLSWRQAAVRFAPLRNALLAGLLAGVGLLLAALGAPEFVSVAVYLGAVVIGARFFAVAAVEELVTEREIGIELLMLLGAAGAMAFGLFEEAAALVFLYAGAEAVEELTFARTRSAIRDLLDLAPKQAHLLAEGGEELVPVEELRPGDVFLVRPGESLATDGIIRSGQTALNEAPVTGESLPVEKAPRDEVFAGSVNGTAAIEVEATRAFEDNTLQRIIHLVEEAQRQKSTSQRFVERFSQRYSPAVLVSALLLALGLPLLGWSIEDSLLRAVTLLVAAAPCALVISIPIAVAAAISRGGREGVLVKGGAQLEALGRVRTICFDKTGTLTRGTPQVTDVVPLDGAHVRDALSVAAAVEARSEHPLARAIVAYARQQGIEPPTVESFEALVGHGARATLNGDELWVGSPAMLQEGASVTTSIPPETAELQTAGKTVVVVGKEGQALALVALRDEPRPEAKDALASLRELGIDRIVMLTGDNERTSRALAVELDIDEVAAELRPEQKVTQVVRLRARHGAIAMVGDGINDAPALAHADVGIALGTGGTDAAIEAADVALMADDLTRVAEALRLGHRARRISLQNLVFSILILAVLIPAAVAGLLTVVAAVLAHETSELLAVANGIRVARGKPVEPRPVLAPEPQQEDGIATGPPAS